MKFFTLTDFSRMRRENLPQAYILAEGICDCYTGITSLSGGSSMSLLYSIRNERKNLSGKSNLAWSSMGAYLNCQQLSVQLCVFATCEYPDTHCHE